MRHTVIASLTLLSLAGCSSEESTTGDSTSTISNAELNGNWTRCLQTGATPPGTSQRRDMTLNNGSGSMLVSNFTGTNCEVPTGAIFPPEPFSYALGAETTVNGSVENITSATAVDIATSSRATFEAFAITNRFTSDQKLYVSDEVASSTDGNSADQRFDALHPVPFTPF